MRGERLIKSLTLFEEETIPDDDGIKVRGRVPELMQQRNERLCARLYYLRVFSDKYYDTEVLYKQLQLEFDLSVVTIPQILEMDEWQVEVKRLKNTKPDINYFKNKWWWIKW